MRNWSKQTRSCASVLAAGLGLLFLSDKITSDSRILFNPEGSGTLRRALSEGGAQTYRRLIGHVNNYDTTQDLTLPDFYSNFANVWEPLIDSDQAILWYVAKTGGNTFTKILCHCLHVTIASKMAAMVEGGLDGTSLTKKSDPLIGSFVNVDVSTSDGITKAKAWNLVPSGMADVIVTQHLAGSSELFSPTNRGRLFVFLRQPIKRCTESFYYRQRATWESNYDKELAAMSIEGYADSNKFVENYITRSLINKVVVDVTGADVALAKDILRRKFFIGLAEPQWYEFTIVKLEKYFGWWDEHQVLTNLTTNYCHNKQVVEGGHFGSHPKLEPRSRPYAKIGVRNWADIELYAYAKKLFHDQTVLV